MNSVARSLCDYLISRNNDIIGYWGIGFICRIAVKEMKNKFSFKVYPGQPIRIYGYELTDSLEITEKLTGHGLDSIEGRLSFFEDGRFPNGSEKYTCGIAVALTQDGRTGMNISHVECWPHDPSLERRSNRYTSPEKESEAPSLLTRVKNIFTGKVEQGGI